MKEFGSDFHRCDADFWNTVAGSSSISLMDVYGCMRKYACGRHAINAIIMEEEWKRMWIPAYFCYEVIEHIASTGIEIKLYEDHPLCVDDDRLVRFLPYEKGDVLLRMNFFGLRSWRSSKDLPVAVIEDHTHDLTSEWARKSDADYCISSIRKSMPVAAGGILWSPKGLSLPDKIATTQDCEKMAELRYNGMQMKRDYLKNESLDKDAFRKKFFKSENMIDLLDLSGMDRETNDIVENMNIGMWSELRAENWQLAYKQLKDKFNVLRPNDGAYWGNPFSIIILCNSAEEREKLKSHLIGEMIYPAILWRMPEDSPFKEALNISHRILSVPCDPRYNKSNIIEMCNRINTFCQ